MRNFLETFFDNLFSLLIDQSPNLCTRAFTLLSNHLFHRFPRSIDHSFSLSDYRKLILSTLHVSNTTTKMIAIAPFQHKLPRSIDHDCKQLGELVVVDVGVGERDCVFEEVLEVDIAGGCVVELIGACELHDVGLITCVGCAIVKGDHAPDCGVAQGDFHGVTARHGENQEEEEGEVEQQVEGHEEENSNTSAHVHGWDGSDETLRGP